MRCPKASVEVKNDVKRALKILGSANLADLFDRQKMRDIYLNYFNTNNYAPASIKKYLISLMDFSTFIIANAYEIEGIDRNQVIAMKLQFEKWRASYNKPARERFWVRQEEDYNMRVGPEHFQKYLAGETAQLAEKVLKQLTSEAEFVNEDIGQSEYCRIRDHLLCLIHFR